MGRIEFYPWNMDTSWLKKTGPVETYGAVGADRRGPGNRLSRLSPDQRLTLLGEHHLEVDEQDGWLRLCLHPGRQRGMASMALIFGVAFVITAWWLPEPEYPGLVIRAALGCFGASLMALAAYLPFNALDVRINRRRMIRIWRWFGLALRTQEIPVDALEDLEIVRAGVGTTGSQPTSCYTLIGRGAFGSIKLTESIPDHDLVEAIRSQVMLAAGLRPPTTH